MLIYVYAIVYARTQICTQRRRVSSLCVCEKLHVPVFLKVFADVFVSLFAGLVSFMSTSCGPQLSTARGKVRFSAGRSCVVGFWHGVVLSVRAWHASIRTHQTSNDLSSSSATSILRITARRGMLLT